MEHSTLHNIYLISRYLKNQVNRYYLHALNLIYLNNLLGGKGRVNIMPLHPLLYYVLLAEKYKERKFKGVGLFREWQQNLPVGGWCWIIDPDFQVRKIKVQPENKEFNRAYKNFVTYHSELDAKNALALIFTILQKEQLKLYGNGADFSECTFTDFFQEELFT